ncbi:MAG: hypothetical protein QOJ49_304 [Actinomycetota bacterium]|nr:hypothetical protein [Actinomycetota bacterium]
MCSSDGAGVEADLAVADTALTRALHAGVDQLTHDQSTALLAQLRVLSAKADALTLALVGRVDAAGTYTLDGALSAAAWVRAVAHQTPGQAARTVRTARTLRSGLLPHTSAALAAGAISGNHAAVIADAVTDAPAGAVALIEPDAVTYAREGDVRATANLMRAFGQALDPDTADEKALRRYDRAGVTFSPLLDGGFAITGTADEATGAALLAAIHAAAPLTKSDQRSSARRRLDGLHTLARHWLDTATPDGDTADRTARRTSRSRARLIVTLDAAALTGHTSPGGTLTWAGPITASTAARLGCDTSATFVTLDPDGNVVEAGTQRRFFTTPQRLAIIARDGDTCPAPFCDRPSTWSDAHHLIPREHGGPTTIANGALPCEGHHLQLHEGHWVLQRLPDGRYLMRHPHTGKTLGPEPPRPGHNRPPPA